MEKSLASKMERSGLDILGERPQSGITACFWHGSCPRAEAWRDRQTILSFAPHLPTGISRSHAESPEGTAICWTGMLGLFYNPVFQ